MSLGEWDGLAPAAAVIGLMILALWPDRPAPVSYNGTGWMEALEDTSAGQAVSWRDPASGRSGTLIPAGIFRASNGLWCRRYSISLEDKSEHPAANRVACRMAQGGWREQPTGQMRQAAHLPRRVEQLATGPL